MDNPQARLRQPGRVVAIVVIALSFWVGGTKAATAQANLQGAHHDQPSAHDDGENAKLQRASVLQIRFGIPIEIQAYAASQDQARQAINAAFDEAKRLDAIFSDYDPDSEARKLAAAEVDVWHPASEELVEVSREARRISAATNGAFDVTVGPLTHLWRKTMRFKKHPDADALQAALKTVGNTKWDVRDEAVQFRIAGMRLDYGGIAKGYALDRMGNVLKQHGVDRFLIDAGGDILCGAAPPGRDAWRIEIEAPRDRNQSDAPKAGSTTLNLSNRAVATSGASYQSVVLDGKRYSHILDPRTGYGVPFLANVTVEAPTGMLADALASAVSVMGANSVRQIQETFPGVNVSVTDASSEAGSR